MPAKRQGAKIERLRFRFGGMRTGAPRRRLVPTVGYWLAAYLVVLQALLAGFAAGVFAAGVMAAPGAADAFTLCLSAASGGDAGADHGGTAPARVFHDCNACPLAGGTPVLLDLPTAGLPQALAIALTTAPVVARAVAPIPLFESARPRAPPQQG